MRLVLLVAVALLCGCATKPDRGVFYYKGTYAPGVAMVADDGRFQSSASVWDESDFHVAREAAIHRAIDAARNAGFERVLVSSAEESSSFTNQFAIAGTFYQSQDAPDGAWPLKDLAQAAAHPGQSMNDLKPARIVPAAKPAKYRRNSSATPASNSEPVSEPQVIEAPDFISAIPKPRPVG